MTLARRGDPQHAHDAGSDHDQHEPCRTDGRVLHDFQEVMGGVTRIAKGQQRAEHGKRTREKPQQVIENVFHEKHPRFRREQEEKLLADLAFDGCPGGPAATNSDDKQRQAKNSTEGIACHPHPVSKGVGRACRDEQQRSTHQSGHTQQGEEEGDQSRPVTPEEDFHTRPISLSLAGGFT